MNYVHPDQPLIPSNLSNPHLAENLHEVRCQVCRGEGKLYEEHADGSLSEQVCPYCHGAKTSVWIKERFDTHHDKVRGVKICIGLVGAFISWPFPFWAHNDTMKWFHFALWIMILGAYAWWYVNPSPKRKGRKVRQPNPLTTNRERLMGGAVLGGALLKAEFDAHHHGSEFGYAQPGGSEFGYAAAAGGIAAAAAVSPAVPQQQQPGQQSGYLYPSPHDQLKRDLFFFGQHARHEGYKTHWNSQARRRH